MSNIYSIGGTPLVQQWIVYDNSRDEPNLVAERPLNQEPTIYQPDIWQKITEVVYD